MRRAGKGFAVVDRHVIRANPNQGAGTAMMR